MEAITKRQILFFVYCMVLTMACLLLTWQLIKAQGPAKCDSKASIVRQQRIDRQESTQTRLHSPTPCDRGTPPPLAIVAIVATEVDARAAAADRALARRLHASVKQHRGFQLRWIFVSALDQQSREISAAHAQLDAEAHRYGDMLTIDSREGLPDFTATLTVIDWSTRHCPGADFLVRTDCSCGVNPFRLVDYLTGLKLTETCRLFLGYLPYRLEPSALSALRAAATAGPIEASSSKPGDFNLQTGPGYLLSMDAAVKLRSVALNGSLNSPHRWLASLGVSTAPDWLLASLLGSLAGLRQRHSRRLFQPMMRLSSDGIDPDSCTDWRAIIVRWGGADGRSLASRLWQHVSAPEGFNPPCRIGT